jgi:hypothetical protein
MATKLYWPPTPGYHLVILQTIGNRRAGGCDHHAGVDESCMTALGQLERFVAAIELVDATNTMHAEARPLIRIQLR